MVRQSASPTVSHGQAVSQSVMARQSVAVRHSVKIRLSDEVIHAATIKQHWGYHRQIGANVKDWGYDRMARFRMGLSLDGLGLILLMMAVGFIDTHALRLPNDHNGVAVVLTLVP
jgi:hypothetical protein